MRRRTTMFLAVTLLLAGCSGDGDQAVDPVDEGDLCRLVEPAELPRGEQPGAGSPKPAASGDDPSCEWTTDKESELTVRVTKMIEASVLEELWKVQPRTVADRDVYVHETGFTRPGGPVLECSAGFQQKNDTLRWRYRVDEPRDGICDDLVAVIQKAIGRLPA